MGGGSRVRWSAKKIKQIWRKTLRIRKNGEGEENGNRERRAEKWRNTEAPRDGLITSFSFQEA